MGGWHQVGPRYTLAKKNTIPSFSVSGVDGPRLEASTAQRRQLRYICSLAFAFNQFAFVRLAPAAETLCHFQGLSWSGFILGYESWLHHFGRQLATLERERKLIGVMENNDRKNLSN